MGGGLQAMGEGVRDHSREDTCLRDHFSKRQMFIDEEFPLA